jgi:hypothetical protein
VGFSNIGKGEGFASEASIGENLQEEGGKFGAGEGVVGAKSAVGIALNNIAIGKLFDTGFCPVAIEISEGWHRWTLAGGYLIMGTQRDGEEYP